MSKVPGIGSVRFVNGSVMLKGSVDILSKLDFVLEGGVPVRLTKREIWLFLLMVLGWAITGYAMMQYKLLYEREQTLTHFPNLQPRVNHLEDVVNHLKQQRQAQESLDLAD